MTQAVLAVLIKNNPFGGEGGRIIDTEVCWHGFKKHKEKIP